MNIFIYLCAYKSQLLRLFTFVLTFIPMSLFAQEKVQYDTILVPYIHTVGLSTDFEQLKPPILRLHSNDHLLLQFDQLDGIPENYRYSIRHCNRNWQIDDLQPYEYMSGFEEGTINNYDNSFGTLQNYFHYYETIPAFNTSFIASGNYILQVTHQDYPDSLLFVRRFRVLEDLTSIQLTIGKSNQPQGDFLGDQELAIALQYRDHIPFGNIQDHIYVYAQQNQRVDLFRELPFAGIQNNRYMYRWSPQNLFPGGNCFRYFDLSNLYTPMYNVQRVDRYAGENFAFLRPEENRSRTNYTYTQTLNGGMKVHAFDRHNSNIEADYVWVNFSLPVTQPFLDGNLYIVGDITQWRLDSNARMDYQPQYHAYTKRLYLKQGYYSYQLLFLPAGEKEAQPQRVEGNHYQTPNIYTVYVYQRTPVDRYDRLVGYTTQQVQW